jgi:hypothetical protein
LERNRIWIPFLPENDGGVCTEQSFLAQTGKSTYVQENRQARAEQGWTAGVEVSRSTRGPVRGAVVEHAAVERLPVGRHPLLRRGRPGRARGALIVDDVGREPHPLLGLATRRLLPSARSSYLRRESHLKIPIRRVKTRAERGAQIKRWVNERTLGGGEAGAQHRLRRCRVKGSRQITDKRKIKNRVKWKDHRQNEMNPNNTLY